MLQDIHWSAGLIGYFATYTLGNVIAAQLARAFRAQHASLDADMRRGDFSALLQWLRASLHQHGRKFEPRELVQRITGGGIDPAPVSGISRRKYLAGLLLRSMARIRRPRLSRAALRHRRSVRR